ncbi:MAG: ribosome recycling factor [Thermodesulfobacteriota bacterium]
MCDEIDLVIEDAETRMNKTIHVLQGELSKVRTGRASTSLVSDIIVEYYGAQTPINQLANITTPDTTSIVIQPWDETAISEIEKAITKSDLGITPVNDGKIIRLNIPSLTEERRKELVKYVSKISEDHKVAIRQIRKDTNNHLKEIEKNEKLPEDIIKKTHKDIQDMTDKMVETINGIFEKKQKEVLEI